MLYFVDGPEKEVFGSRNHSKLKQIVDIRLALVDRQSRDFLIQQWSSEKTLHWKIISDYTYASLHKFCSPRCERWASQLLPESILYVKKIL